MMRAHTGEKRLTEEEWSAIKNNDPAYNDKFIYAVKTTGIFCRPSCRSKLPKRENVRIFQNAGQALSEHYRPCKRCKPTGGRLPDAEWVAQMKRCIDTNYREKLTLELLADICHGSPYHLHRMFKRITGITPAQYIQQTRTAKAAELLVRSNKTIAEIAAGTGFPSTPYFITIFKKMTGHTPSNYRQMISSASNRSEVFYRGSQK